MTTRELLPSPKNFDEAWNIASIMADSQMIPKAFQKRPQDVVVAMMWAHSLGIPTVQGLNYIAVINGKPSMYGDGLLAVVMASGQMADFQESFVGSDKELTAICKVTRKGLTTPFIGSFSIADAETAGLLNKPGPWKQYPKRMLKMRARAFALRDAFPDVLSGMGSAEEQVDIIGEATEKETEAAPIAAKREMPRRKKKAAEAIETESPAAADSPIPAENTPAEPLPQVTTEATAPEQPPEVEAATAQAEEPAPAEQPEHAVGQDDVLQKLKMAQSRGELLRIWASLPASLQSQAEVRDAFKLRQSEIKAQAMAGGSAQ